MMDVLIRNASGNLSIEDRDYASKKLSKLDRYFHRATKVEIVHRAERTASHEGHKIEVTVFADGMTIRSEDVEPSLRAAIDKAADRIESRLRRIKHRIVDRYRSKGKEAPSGFEAVPSEELEDDDHVRFHEVKQVSIKPQTRDDAALEMELLGHDFFMYQCQETGRTELIYRRKSGGYGLLVPEG
jgi:putative sigma-54 modulation protein